MMVICLVILPHSKEHFGKMELHQIYGTLGRYLSFGLIDRTLVDWYMVGPSMIDNVNYYDNYIKKSVLILTPIYLLWSGAFSIALHRITPHCKGPVSRLFNRPLT